MKKELTVLGVLAIMTLQLYGQQDSFPRPYQQQPYLIGINLNGILNGNSSTTSVLFEYKKKAEKDKRWLQFWQVGLNFLGQLGLDQVDTIVIQGIPSIISGSSQNLFNGTISFGPSWYLTKKRTNFNLSATLGIGYTGQARNQGFQGGTFSTINHRFITTFNVGGGITYSLHPQFSIGGKIFFTTLYTLNYFRVFENNGNTVLDSWTDSRLQFRFSQNAQLFLAYHF